MVEELKKNLYGIVLYFPSEVMESFRAFFYKCIGIRIGKNVQISIGSILDVWNHQTPFYMGDNVRIGRNCFISGGVRVGSGTSINSNVNMVASPPNVIDIGENCLIAQNVLIRSDDHKFNDVNRIIASQGRIGADILIGQDCWIGANAVLLKGVHLGAHSIVGAGAVVTKSFPPYSVIVGNPARLIKSRI